MEYKVTTGEFEGPLDLLLDLINEQKLDITRVSLAQITDEYLAYVRSQEGITLGNLAEFLHVAAKLILIKSQALLPLLHFEEDEEADLYELERQLAALKVVKDAVPDFAALFDHPASRFARRGMWGVEPQFTPPADITVNDLEEAFKKSLHAIPQLDVLEEKIVSEIVSLERRITDVQKMVQKKAKVAFSEIVAEAKDQAEVVVSFLALLELVKQKIIDVDQTEAFADMTIESSFK